MVVGRDVRLVLVRWEWVVCVGCVGRRLGRRVVVVLWRRRLLLVGRIVGLLLLVVHGRWLESRGVDGLLGDAGERCAGLSWLGRGVGILLLPRGEIRWRRLVHVRWQLVLEGLGLADRLFKDRRRFNAGDGDGLLRSRLVYCRCWRALVDRYLRRRDVVQLRHARGGVDAR